MSRGPHVIVENVTRSSCIILLDCCVTIFQQSNLDIHSSRQKFYLIILWLFYLKLPEDWQSVIEALQIKTLPTTMNVKAQLLKCPHVVLLSSSLAAWSSTHLISFKTRRWALVSICTGIRTETTSIRVLSLRLVV